MATQAAPAATHFQLLQMGEGLIVNQSLYAVASLGVADLLRDRPRTTAELARELGAHEPALYRVLRMLASQGVFEETAPRTFGNSELSRFLCTGAPGSVRSMILFRGSELFYRCFGEILHSVKTGESARAKLFGKAWEYLREHPELARIFDDAMTELSALVAPAIAASYDFGAYGTLMDV